MTVRVGVIGVGMIGRDHIRRLTGVLAGSTVVAVSDLDEGRAREAALGLASAHVHPTGQDLIDDDGVEAVVVASSGDTHEGYVLACIAAGKPVFCEKPLAMTADAGRRIVDAEVAFGRRLVQVGFMRRYDDGFRALKDVVAGGSIGAPLLMHCAHRNPTMGPGYTPAVALAESTVHEFDAVRWLLDDEIAAVTVFAPRRNARSLGEQDPLLLVAETASGAFVDIEAAANARYGYDIRCEVVGEDGTAELGAVSPVVVRSDGAVRGRVPDNWWERFERAYDVELQDWVDSVTAGEATGPSAWDGYAAAAIGDAGIEALRTAQGTPVVLGERPELYIKV